jgi:transcription termination/antitermination protein NusA
MNAEFIEALRQIERERDIPFESLMHAIEAAVATAYKKSFNVEHDVSLRIEHTTGKNPIYYRRLTVVETATDKHTEISLADARARFNIKADLGDVVEEKLVEKDMEQMSRIAAQTAKQVVVQRIREAERDKVYDEFDTRKGEIVTGTLSRYEGRNMLISLGKLEAYLTDKEQVPGERFKINERVKVLILEVRKGPKGPQVIVSRSHPTMIRRLFELEVPEINETIVSIKNVAREPGQRSKIAVASREERIDPVGACVGHRGQRVQAVVDELRGEKIDIVRWNADMKVFITESLSPAKVSSVRIDEFSKAAYVVVPDSQLSLAIGKSGQNVRLAARLTGWRIDIRSDSQARDGQIGISSTGDPDVDDGSDLPMITLAGLGDEEQE